MDVNGDTTSCTLGKNIPTNVGITHGPYDKWGFEWLINKNNIYIIIYIYIYVLFILSIGIMVANHLDQYDYNGGCWILTGTLG